MAERYFVDCSCGQRIPVELFEAGSTTNCSACKSPIRIPGLTQLKQLSGDKYPLLSPIEKIRQALLDTAPPFDGRCQNCEILDADYQVPVTLHVMAERHVDNEGGVRPTISGGILLHAGSAIEQWQTTTFPLLLCTPCYTQFQSAQSSAAVVRALKVVGLVTIFCVFLYVAYAYTEVVAAVAGVFSIIGAFAWMATQRSRKRIDPYILQWIGKIRWVPEAIAAEEEFTLSVGAPQPLRRV